ncbi:MAG: 7,8-didemethyl-8-hydroxy-5-deazariboflavin synthase CofG [Xanthobacteraceae bacterium]
MTLDESSHDPASGPGDESVSTSCRASRRDAQLVLGERADLLLNELNDLPLADLLARARARREQGHGRLISYSRKIFIPLTRLCRDCCAYCTFAAAPREVAAPFLSPDEVLAIARAGQRAGCREALFTLGDKPELRYAAARETLAALGYESTVDYLAAMCERVLNETGLLPHVNAGVMAEEDIARLRRVSVSQGIMLESIADRLGARGGPHYGSPDKAPAVRLAMIAAAGRQRVPFTSGILIGIGETRRERVASLLALRDLHAEHGHLQEIIIQNFRAKPDTRMAAAAEPHFDDLLWTAAIARLIFGAQMNIQVPPNLSDAHYPKLLDAGINDWGGISPVTPTTSIRRRRGRSSTGWPSRPPRTAMSWSRASQSTPPMSARLSDGSTRRCAAWCCGTPTATALPGPMHGWPAPIRRHHQMPVPRVRRAPPN